MVPKIVINEKEVHFLTHKLVII